MVIKDGSVTFTLDDPNDPLLHLIAEKDLGNMVVMLKLGGKSTKPDFHVTSVPALSQEEVISKMMFGEDTTHISWLQSLQIASVLASLNDKKSLDVFGKLKSILGLDTLTIKDDPQTVEGKTNSSVSVTKQLTDKFGVAFEKGTNANTGKAGIFGNITPNLKIEIDVGRSAETNLNNDQATYGGGAGITYSRRY